MLKFTLQLACIICFAITTFAQGPTVLTTEGGPTTGTHPLTFGPSVDSLRLQFNFGFGTDETPSTPGFLDSFTVTLQDNAAQSTAIYLTADANGEFWAPVTPGTLFMDPNSINRNSIPFGGLQPSHSTEFAYHVDAPIPSEFAGKSATLYFDLFDNDNTFSSLGWYGDVVLVPEPSTVALGVVGGTILVFFIRFRRKNFIS